jgi:23S rRNA-/tRNA-specific pseudouridylate synthase
MIVDAGGQKSVTDYRVLGRAKGMTWLELKPRTGRTHQIRVHCAWLGCPVLGDDQYGHAAGVSQTDRLQLHARAVAVPLNPGKPPISVEAPPPEHMKDALMACGWKT